MMTSNSGDAEDPEKNGETSCITPSTAKLNQLLASSPGPRNLTPYEVELLRQSAKEIYQALREAKTTANSDE